MGKAPTSKVCTKCKIEKQLSDFYERGDGSSATHQSRCSECVKKYYREKWKNRTSQEKDKRRSKFRKWYDGLRDEIIEKYGGKCSCCGEDKVEFLSVDHVNGGGVQHRKELGGGTAFFVWLKKNNFPKNNYRLLCMNCNWARGRYGYCPHEGGA